MTPGELEYEVLEMHLQDHIPHLTLIVLVARSYLSQKGESLFANLPITFARGDSLKECLDGTIRGLGRDYGETATFCPYTNRRVYTAGYEQSVMPRAT